MVGSVSAISRATRVDIGRVLLRGSPRGAGVDVHDTSRGFGARVLGKPRVLHVGRTKVVEKPIREVELVLCPVVIKGQRTG